MKNIFAARNVVGWTAIDIGTDGLYGVTVLAPQTRGGKPRAVKCGFVPGQLDAGALSELSEKISVPGCPWTLLLGHKTYNILVVPEPTVQQDELEKSVRWSVGNMVDYPVEEAGIAYMPIPVAETVPNRPPNLYVAVAKKEVIAAHNAVFEKAGIPLQAIDVRETAQRNIAALAETPGKGLGLLSIGKQGVQFIITFQGALYLDRFIEESLFGNASQDEEAGKRACERIALQVQRSLDLIGRTLTFIDIDRILIAPMPAKLAQREADVITQQLSVPVKSLDLAAIFDFSATPELAREENQAGYFSAIGAALRFTSSSRHINLQIRRERNGLGAVWAELTALALVFLTLLGIWGVRQGEVAKAREAEAASALQLQQARAALQVRMQLPAADPVAEIEALRPRAEAARKILSQTGSLGSQRGYAAYFSSLASVAEEGVWLRSVTVDKAGKSVRVSGRAMHTESVLRYVRGLNAVFAPYSVQFTELELTPELAGKPGDGKPPLAVVAFNLN